MSSRAFWSAAVVCGCVSGVCHAQPPAGGLPVPDGAPVGQRLPTPWGYAGWTPTGVPIGGPYVGYPVPYRGSGVGVFAYGASPGFWPNGLSLYGPPVPVSGPIPGVFGNSDLASRFQAVPFNGVSGYGVVGVTVPLSRPLLPPTVPVIERLPPAPSAPVAAPRKSGGSLFISMRLPQPAAAVFVNGRPTELVGTDRLYESPPLEAGRSYTFTITARWYENGQVVEMTKSVTGMPGEVARVDFGAAPVFANRK